MTKRTRVAARRASATPSLPFLLLALAALTALVLLPGATADTPTSTAWSVPAAPAASAATTAPAPSPSAAASPTTAPQSAAPVATNAAPPATHPVVAAATTSLPPVTTTAPPVTTATPAAIPAATPPVTQPATAVPAATTVAPSASPAASPTAKPPTATHAAPAATTKAPAATTKAPATTSKAPAITTKAPVVTSKAPAKTTAAPAMTTSALAAATSAAPAPAANMLVVSSLSAEGHGTCDPDYEVKDATTGACDCKPGFSGWGCRMCASTSACAAIQPDLTCAQGLKYDNHTLFKTYDCRLDPDLQALFDDGAMAVACNRTSRVCTAAVYKAKATVRSAHVIDCTLTDCAFANNSANGACANITCKCSDACSPMAKLVIEQSLSGKPVKLHATNSTSVALEIEGAPLPLSAQCTASQCEMSDSGSGSGSGGGGDDDDGSGWPSGLVVAVITCASVAALMLLCVLACSCFVSTRIKRGQTDLETELSTLAPQSGHVLEFRHVSCFAAQPKASAASKATSSDAPDGKKRILHKVSGRVARGSVLGLLGPSGSGKTSLLNALAAVENGRCVTTGKILVDGAKIAKDYRRVAAYVQQDDALFATLTVRECIQYSAQLRLPARASETAKDAMVERVISELNLGHIVNARIGSHGASRGISGGERRRVSIGMELVTSPQILFLDEPTSGLDSSSANSVVQLVKELASHGRIVVMSIHQPSAKSFLQLDQVMLLAKGKMLYHGPPATSKQYFQDLGFICPENENIADFILDIASDTKNIPNIRAHMKRSSTPRGAGSAASASSFTPKFTISDSPRLSESSPFMNEDTNLDTPRVLGFLGSPTTASDDAASMLSSQPTPRGRSPSSPPNMRPHARRSGVTTAAAAMPSRSVYIEIRVLFRRTAQNILRHRSLLLLHVFLSLTLALFGGLIFNHVTNDLAGFQNRSGAFYFILTFFGFASMSSMDLFITERTIFLRETGALYYGAFSYFVAKATLDTLLLRVLPATLFASIFYWIMGLQASLSHFLLFLGTVVLFNVAAGSISVFVGVLAHRVGTANLSATVVFLVMLLFGGFLLNAQTMPSYVGWLKHFSIFSYAFEILMTNELKGLLLKFDAPGYPSVPVYGDVFLKTLGMDYDNRYYDLVSLAVIAFGLQVLAYLFLSLQVPQRHELVDAAPTDTDAPVVAVDVDNDNDDDDESDGDDEDHSKAASGKDTTVALTAGSSDLPSHSEKP